MADIRIEVILDLLRNFITFNFKNVLRVANFDDRVGVELAFEGLGIIILINPLNLHQFMLNIVDIDFCLLAWHVVDGLRDLVQFLRQLFHEIGGLRRRSLSTENINVPHEGLRGAKLHSNDVAGALGHAAAQERNADELGVRRQNSVIRHNLGRFLENAFFNLKVFGGCFDHEVDIVEAILHSLRVTYP